MTVKLSLLTLLIICAITSTQAQQNEDCNAKLSYFHEFVKSGNFDAAHEPWSYVRENCPDINMAIYIDGEKILKDKIDKANGPAKSKHVEDLVSLWEQRVKYFANKTAKGEYAAKACQLKYDYRSSSVASDIELYNCFDQAFKEDRATFVNPKSLYTYFSLMVDLYDKKEKSDSELFDKYEEVTEKIEEEIKLYSGQLNQLLEKTEKDQKLSSTETKNKGLYENYLENYHLISENIDKKLSIKSNCVNLIPLYTKEFKSRQNDAVWLRRAVSRMFHKECTSEPLYEELVKKYDEVAPSADTKIYVVTVLIKNGKTDEIEKYLNEAYNLETDSFKKAKLASRIGHIFKNRGQYSQARNYFRNALDLNPSNGYPHLAIAAMYDATAKDCGDSNFNKRAVFWLAASEARKAGEVDPRLRQAAIQTAASYEAKAPSKKDIFLAEKSGLPVKIGCWINATMTIPKID